MVNRFKKIFALAALLLIVSPISASVAEIPLLTWERGQLQEVVLGGQAAAENWRVELQGNGIAGLELKKSSLNPQGFAVYSLVITRARSNGFFVILYPLDPIRFTPATTLNSLASSMATIEYPPSGVSSGITSE